MADPRNPHIESIERYLTQKTGGGTASDAEGHLLELEAELEAAQNKVAGLTIDINTLKMAGGKA